MNEWQPIATAPKDGQVVDLWHKNGFRITENWWIEEDNCWSGTWSDDDFTHWKALPEPPT